MRPKDEQKEKLILDTALSLIARVGLAGLKMTDLAKEAGLATGTVYIYFEDKNALIQRLYLFLSKKSSVDLLETVTSDAPLKLQIKTMAFNYLKNCLEKPEIAAFFEQYYRSPFAAEVEEVIAAENQQMQPIYDLVLRGQQEQIIKNINAELLVTLVCGMISELSRVALFENRLVSDAEWQDTFTVIWDAIKS